jgi:cell division transport system permease protein
VGCIDEHGVDEHGVDEHGVDAHGVAMKVSYFARETGSNLVRNLTLSLASVLTIAMSLTLTGVSLNLKKGLDQVLAKWEGGVEYIVFMKPTATQQQVDAVGRTIKASPYVDGEKVRMQTKEENLKEFQRLTRDQPGLAATATVEKMPVTWRVVPKSKDVEVNKAAAEQFRTEPNVLSVTFAADSIRRFQRLMQVFLWIFTGAAIALVVSSAILITNTIRLAIFSRRREIEVMKLVGATNSFIRVPFMLEGLVQAVTGAGIAWGVSWLVNRRLARALFQKGTSLDQVTAFSLSAGEVRATGLVLLGIGIVLGAVGSGLAVSRFLDV